MIKVSVIIPIYNVERFIERCVKSLFEQTLKEIEYIFFDDCGSDRSVEILEKLLIEYPECSNNVRLIKNPHNMGSARIRQMGISIAKGEYIAYCDSDDFVAKNMYEKLYKKAKEGNYDIAFCDWNIIDKHNNMHPKIRHVYENKLDFIKSVLKGKEMGNVWSLICKKSVFTNNLIKFPQYTMIEDTTLLIQMIYYAKNFTYVKAPLYSYCINLGGSSRKMDENSCVKRYQDIKGNIKTILSFIESADLSSYLSDETYILKYWARLQIGPITYMNKYYKLWNNTYPEIDRYFLKMKNIPIKLLLNYFLIKSHIYGLFSKILRIK